MSGGAGGLRFFLDSADRRAWEKATRAGWLAGVTTNPTLLAREGLKSSVDTARDMVRAAEDLGFSELQVQTSGGDAASLAETGLRLAALGPIVTVKVPATPEGVVAARQIRSAGHRVTLTACYTVRQCAVARALGLDYVAPYYGRMAEAGLDVDARLDGMRAVAVGSGLRVLIASLRNADQLENLLCRGFDTFTLSPALVHNMVADAGSQAAAEAFEVAANGPAKAP